MKMDARPIRTAFIFGALTLLYFVVGKLSLRFAFVHVSASPVWPPTGIALAALLITPIATTPAIPVTAPP